MSDPAPDDGTTASKKKAPKPTVKKAAKHAVPVGPIRVRWTLAELPSSQHKAGLAGLVLCVRYLERKDGRKGTCSIVDLDAASLTLEVDRDGMQELFDDIYAASLEEQERDKPFQNKQKVQIPPKRTFEKTITNDKGVAKTKTMYVYDQTVPAGGLIGDLDAAPSGTQKPWLKLWRDLVWTTLRGVPATREPYASRAEKKEMSDGHDAWDELASKPSRSVELPSTYYLGAQATTAENVSFRDQARMRVLLHFWPFAVPIYVPSAVDREGKRDFLGYALVMPDIVDLDGFVNDWSKLARGRGSELQGYVPREAVVDLPGEAGLDLAVRAMDVIKEREGGVATRAWLVAADVFHIEKEGNNVRTRRVARIDLERTKIDRYAQVRRAYWSHEFRQQRIVNILDGRPQWWAGFGRLCATMPQESTFSDSKFRHDCRAAFTEVEMTKEQIDQGAKLEHRIYRMVRSFVSQKIVVKYGEDWKWDRVEATGRTKEYKEKREKIAREAFLAVRSRTGADFVSYFTSSICSVPQFLDEPGFVEVARALHSESEVEHVRSLTLLALSANAG